MVFVWSTCSKLKARDGRGGGQAALVFGAIVGCDCCLWPHTRKEDERGISSVYPDGSKFSVGVVSW